MAALPVVMVSIVICAVTLLGLTRIGDAAVRRARADAIADVAALAGVGHGRGAASEVAAASGAQLRTFRGAADGAVQVEIGFQGVTARAAAAASGQVMSGVTASAEPVPDAEVRGDPDPQTGRR